MSEITLAAEYRSEFGKGAARRLRRDGKVPAVLYGHGTDPVHVALPGHDVMMALKHSNALLSIDIEGKAQLAIAKDIQRDPVRQIIEHVDLLVVDRGEKVTVEVPVHVAGDPAPGATYLVEQLTLEVEAEATHLPESIVVSIEGLTAGTILYAGDIVLPDGVSLVTDQGADVIIISEVRSAGDGEAAE